MPRASGPHAQEVLGGHAPACWLRENRGVSQTTYFVTGMTCQHCVTAVEEEVGALPGVDAVDVDLIPGGTSTVTVSSAEPVAEDHVRAAVDEAGYVLTGSLGG